MLTIPSGSVVVVPGVALHYTGWLLIEDPGLYSECAPHLKETSSKARSMARYGVPYTYKGRPLPSYEFTPFLEYMRVRLAVLLGVEFNAAVVNYYADGSKGVGMHSDTRAIPQLGKQPVIASVSFGATRAFHLQGLKKADQPIITQLGHGDLFVMHGSSQSHYKHGVPVTDKPVAPRWSVTFRYHVVAEENK